MKTNLVCDKMISSFPTLMESTTKAGRVVLFTSPTCGTVVYISADDTMYPLGYYSTQWEEVNFKPFEGKVELSN